MDIEEVKKRIEKVLDEAPDEQLRQGLKALLTMEAIAKGLADKPEPEKVELRHGDYRITEKDGEPQFAVSVCDYLCNMDSLYAYSTIKADSRDDAMTSPPYGNIFDKLKDGPILIGLTVKEAKCCLTENSGDYTQELWDAVAAKVKAALDQYKEATK